LESQVIASARLDCIDEAMIETYIQERRRVALAAKLNRELATLRRLLRLAHEWKEINRVPKIRLLNGERVRDFVLSRRIEESYLAACPQPLADVTLLILEAELRIGEVLSLSWADVELDPLIGSRFGYLRFRDGKSKNAKRTIPLTDKAAEMLRNRKQLASGDLCLCQSRRKPLPRNVHKSPPPPSSCRRWPRQGLCDSLSATYNAH
jgi:integrase